jgi:basic amino acid/polyamine antiporter, APA family
VRAVALLGFAFGGWEDALLPTGEVRDPRRTIPFALGTGLLSCAAIYMLLQFVTVVTVGPNATVRPVAETSSILLGRGGVALVSLAIMVSTYGWISAELLSGPRLAYALAAKGDFPAPFARIHPRFHTPGVAILGCASIAWILAVTGTALFVLAISAGAAMIYYAAMCASLIRLRTLRPKADAFRTPFGPVLSCIAVVVAFGLITGLKPGELLLMLVTALIASVNWICVKHWNRKLESTMKAEAARRVP